MEEHDLAVRLQQNRARLRSLLLPDPETGHIEADVFPRSIAMRALVAGVPVLLASLLRGRSARAAAWPQVAMSLVQAIGLRQR
jgi:hypothetical protein